MSVKTKKSLLKTLVIVTLVVLCGGVNIANAGNLSTGSYYLQLSNFYAATAHMWGTTGLYVDTFGGDPSNFTYNAYLNMSNATAYAYWAYMYCYNGYVMLGSTNAYYAYTYAYNDYVKAAEATAYLYYCYTGRDFTIDAIMSAYYAQFYNGVAAFYAGIANVYGYY